MAMRKMKSAMKAMKAKKAMKATKAKKSMKKGSAMKMRKMKAKKASIIARGKMSKSQVYKGRKVKTVGGLTKDKLTKNKYGKVVSKAASANARKGKSAVWAKAVAAARKTLGIKGFQAIGGKTAKGQALLKKVRSLYK